MLTDHEIAQAAKSIGIEPAALKAFYKVESNGDGFLLSGKPKILFEGHVFWKNLKVFGLNPLKFVGGNEDILYPKWTKIFYLGGEKEYSRLERARKIHHDAALMSTSFGAFQIMGFNYKTCGYSDIVEFVRAMEQSEINHLRAVVKFLANTGILHNLKSKDWEKVAEMYNGTGYALNNYHIKLENYYNEFSLIS